MRRTKLSTPLFHTGGSRGFKPVPELPLWETLPRQTHSQLFTQSIPTRGRTAHFGHSAQGGVTPAQPLVMDAPIPSPEGGADHKRRLWGQTAWGRAAAGRLPAVRPSTITLPPLPREMRGTHPGAPRRLSEVLHVNFVRQCRPSSVTAPSSVTVSVARVSCREGSLQSAFLQPTQQSKGQKTLRSGSPRAVALGGDAVPLKARTLGQTASPGGKSPLPSADMSRGIPRDFLDPTCCGLHGVPPKFIR